MDHNNLSCNNSRIHKVFYTTQNYKYLGVKGEIVNQTDSEQYKDKKSKIKTNEDGEDNNIIYKKLGHKIKIFFSYLEILDKKLFKSRIINILNPHTNYQLITKVRSKSNQFLRLDCQARFYFYNRRSFSTFLHLTQLILQRLNSFTIEYTFKCNEIQKI